MKQRGGLRLGGQLLPSTRNVEGRPDRGTPNLAYPGHWRPRPYGVLMSATMPTTYQVDMSKWAGTDVTGTITVT